MKYFIDTEFNELIGEDAHYSPTIDLISIGIVDDEGRAYYAEHRDFCERLCNPWVKENVLPKLGLVEKRKSSEEIAKDILAFVGRDPDPEFWAYYASYDWVVFCWLFGPMVDLPKHFPMHPMDLQQWWKQLGSPPDVKPPDPAEEHNALIDALWNKQLHAELDKYQKGLRRRLVRKIF